MKTLSNIVTVTNVEQLRSLLRVRVFERPPMQVTIQLDSQDDVENELLESKINRYYNACGCGEGKFFVVLALAAFFIKGAAQAHFSWSWYHAGVAFLYCLGGAFIGKAWGQVNAYLKLRKSIREALSKKSKTSRPLAQA
ncbi:hypothetical protein [Parapedobacter sp. DT-150]|uniref:hypothetical protein n=1 Tax=Parapedobacter sp. DT-150 TaxID=3396162 RepID=UPI003F1D33D5